MAKTQWTVLLAFASIYIIWGSTYLAILIGLETIPPFLLSAFRFLIAGSLLFVWCLLNKDKMPSRQDMLRNSMAGILMLFGGTVSVTWAEQYISSTLAAIIVTSLPFWFVILDKKQWSYYFANKVIIAGLMLGFIGVIFLVSFGRSGARGANHEHNLEGALAIIGGGIAWTIGSLYSKYQPAQTSLMMNGSIQLLSTGLFTGIVALIAGEQHRFNLAAVTVSSWLGMLYLAIMGSIAAYLSYLYLLKIRPAAQVSTYVYVNPVVALLLGAVVVSEPVGWMQVIALLIILAGVLLVNMPKYRQAFKKA